MWENYDKLNYVEATTNNLGQICNSNFSMQIKKYASNLNLKTFLEIGTWNGLGSTKAFSEGFSNRVDDYIFYSLECNKDKSLDANNLYKHNHSMHILNEVIWNEEPSNFYEIFPECKTNHLYKHWNEIDLINMQKCDLFLNRPSLPKIFDVILLDGGEFTTFHEFQLLKNRCKILMLDDTETNKCKLIVNEILQDASWRIIMRETERNGFIIAEKIFF
jgi:hypothetical protein